MQADKLHFCIRVRRKCDDLEPIACCTPIAFNRVRALQVSSGLNFKHVVALPIDLRAEVAHHADGHVQVWTARDVARQGETQTVLQGWSYHQEGRDVLRTDIARHTQRAAFERIATNDAQRRETLFAFVSNGSPKRAKRLDEDADGTMLHAFGSCDNVLAWRNTQVSREEPHCSACSPYVDGLRHCLQSTE